MSGCIRPLGLLPPILPRKEEGSGTFADGGAVMLGVGFSRWCWLSGSGQSQASDSVTWYLPLRAVWTWYGDGGWLVWCVLLLEGLVFYPERRDLDNAESSIECGVPRKPNRAPEVCGWSVQGGSWCGNSSLAASLLAVLGGGKLQ
jgi:hypothetical protein